MLTEQEIITLIQLGEERPDLDYKDDINLTASKGEKAEIAKDIIAMANSGGGLIVAGVRETSTGYVLKGMSRESLEVFDSTALNDFVKSYCAPPINTSTRKVKVGTYVCGVIIVPGFVGQPHIVTKDYPNVLQTGDLLVRSASNNSRRAGPEELRNLIDLAIHHQQSFLKDMLQAALESSKPLLIGGTSSGIKPVEAPFDRERYKETFKGFRIVTMAPVGTQISVRPTMLRGAAMSAVIQGRQGYPDFPPTLLDIIPGKRLPVGIVFEQVSESSWPSFSFAFFSIHGQVFCADSMWEDARLTPEDTGRVGLLTTITTMFQAILFARQYYLALGHKGEVRVRYSQESSVPRFLIVDSDEFWPLGRNSYNDMAIPVTVERSFRTDASLEALEETTKDMLIEFFWYFHLDLNMSNATNYLEHIKKKIKLPKDTIS